jgi:hypothetical protein
MNNEFKRMMELAGLTDTQNTDPSTKLYAVVNYSGDRNDGVALYFSTSTKEEMLEKLNKATKQFAGMFTDLYTLDNLEETTYNGNPLDRYIDDDWAIVTKNPQDFKGILKDINDSREKKPEEYKG